MTAKKSLKINLMESNDDNKEKEKKKTPAKKIVKKIIEEKPKQPEATLLKKAVVEEKIEPIIESKDPEYKVNEADKNLLLRELRGREEAKKLWSANKVKKEDLLKNTIKGNSEENKKETAHSVHMVRSIKFYRKIAFAFMLFTILLLGAIFYFSFVKVSITLFPKQERVSNNLLFDVYDIEKNPIIKQGLEKKAIGGAVNSITVNHESTYETAGQTIIGEEAVGRTVIINNHTSNQPLVATTRLLTSDNKLFRIRDTINVPAGGSVEVDIYADKPGPDMAIGPAKFTIPGLWAGLQTKIFAESKGNVEYRQKVKKEITKKDLDDSLAEIKDQLIRRVKAEVNNQYRDYDQIIYKLDENSIISQTDGKIGEEKESFKVSAEAEVIVAAFNEDKIQEYAKQKIIASVPENISLTDFNKESMDYALISFNLEEGLASINCVFEGKTSITEASAVVDKNKIIDLNKEQLEVYLQSIPEITGYEIKFYPNFYQKVPRLPEKIEIKM